MEATAIVAIASCAASAPEPLAHHRRERGSAARIPHTARTAEQERRHG